jgi:hypothetical protein
MAYATVAHVKNYAGITVSTYDTEISGLLDEAFSLINNHCMTAWAIGAQPDAVTAASIWYAFGELARKHPGTSIGIRARHNEAHIWDVLLPYRDFSGEISGTLSLAG